MNNPYGRDELDVRELVRALRAEVVHAQGEGEVCAQDLEVIRTCHDVRDYELSTDKPLAPLVVAAKRVVEALVKPYAGHFLDKQTHFNTALQRVITALVVQLEGIGQRLASIQEEQRALRQVIQCNMDDLRARIDHLRCEMAERHQSLCGVLQERLAEQDQKLEECHAATVSRLQQEMAVALERLQARLQDIERASLESQRDIKERFAKELQALVDFIEEMLPVVGL